jgi:hypothetical protein
MLWANGRYRPHRFHSKKRQPAQIAARLRFGVALFLFPVFTLCFDPCFRFDLAVTPIGGLAVDLDAMSHMFRQKASPGEDRAPLRPGHGQCAQQLRYGWAGSRLTGSRTCEIPSDHMNDEKDDRRQTPPTAHVSERKTYVAPTLNIYGNLQQITAAVGVNGQKDGGSGMKNIRSLP